MKKNSMLALGAGVLGGYAAARLLAAGIPRLPAHTAGTSVVILRAGFGGLAAASKLSRFGNHLQITLVDRHNYHLFTPMLYQAATCGIVPYDAAIPVRHWSGRNHIFFRNDTVRGIDLNKHLVHLEGVDLACDCGSRQHLRVENQLGYKMIKWIERVEFVESEKRIGEGEGGRNEDDEYFDLLPNILKSLNKYDAVRMKLKSAFND